MACTCGHPGLGCECYYQPMYAGSYYDRRVPLPPREPKPKKAKVPNYRIERKVTVTLSGTRISVSDLRELIKDMADTDSMRVIYTNFDNSPDPRESSYVTLEFSPKS